MKKNIKKKLITYGLIGAIVVPGLWGNSIQAKAEVNGKTVTNKTETGWVNKWGSIYYISDSDVYNKVETPYGVAITGVCEVDGKTYYFRPDGRLWYADYGTNIYTYDGIEYYYTIGTGELTPLADYTGIVKQYQYTFYYVNGVRQTKWQEVDGETYYFLENGKTGYARAATGVVTIDGVEYEFDKSGKLISPKKEDNAGNEEESKEETTEDETTEEETKVDEDTEEEEENDSKEPTIHVEVPEYAYTSCGITAEDWSNRTTYGWNLGNALSATYGAWDKTTNIYINQEEIWGQPKTSLELIQYVKAQGFNSVRVPVTFFRNAYKDANGEYHINEEWLDRVAEVVEMCLENDMTVYICPMCDSLAGSYKDAPILLGQGSAEMEEVYKYCRGMWTDIAERFKGFDGRLAFESYNEVWIKGSGKTVYTKMGHEQMNQINQIFVDAVRSTGGANSDRVLILATYGHEYDYGALNDFVLPNDTASNRLIVSVHEYAVAYDQQLDSIMRQIADFRDRIGVPVMINEWGYTDNTMSKNYELQRKAYANFSYITNKYNIKSYVWDNGGMSEFGLIKRANFNESDAALISAITHPEENITSDVVIITSANDPQMNLQYRFSKDRSGIEYHPWWGFLAFGEKEHGYEIPEGTKYFEASILKHTTDLKAIRFETFSCAFYDENGKLVGEKSWKNNGTLVVVPENAKYVRVLCYNQFEECKPAEIQKWFDSGEIRFYCSFIK